MPTAALHTLGCKVNQYETQKMAEALHESGFDIVDFGDRADVYVINSCTVTQTADSKSRQAARAAARRNPEALVVLTGCFVETSPDGASRTEGVSLVLRNRDKSEIVRHICSRMPTFAAQGGDVDGGLRMHGGRTRALLKIQDGCDQYCSYCAVPFARPEMVSRPASEVLAEAGKLAALGYKEVVLTGIRLGRYRDGDTDLAAVVDALSEVQGIRRIRMSSLEFTDAPPNLLEIMALRDKVCKHLHLPLQSGNDDVLRRMNRPYAAAEFEKFVRAARRLMPDIAITTDVMVGFPGETAGEFADTRRLVERLQFARAHVFRYSPRESTAASRLRNDVPEIEKKRRSEVLIELAARNSERFAGRFVGRTMPVLVEGEQCRAKFRSGLTDNYIRVHFPDRRSETGDIVDVRVERVSEGKVYGRVHILQDCDARSPGRAGL